MSIELSKQVSLANALVQNLEIYGDSGYELMAGFAFDFLNSIAGTGTIDTHIENYLSEIQKLHSSRDWINDRTQSFSNSWIMSVITYNAIRTSDNHFIVDAAYRPSGIVDKILELRSEQIHTSNSVEG